MDWRMVSCARARIFNKSAPFIEYYWHLARKTCYQKHKMPPQQPLKNKITVNGVVEIILLAAYQVV